MVQSIKTFLMFEGNAEAAMNFYVSLFGDARCLIRALERQGGSCWPRHRSEFGDGESGP